MSKAQPTLSDFATDADNKDISEQKVTTQPQREAARWRVEPPRCQCGAELHNWHSTAEAREMVRQFGGEDGTVPACPSCTEYSHPSGEMTGVARAVRISDRTSSVERLTPAEELRLKVRDGGA